MFNLFTRTLVIISLLIFAIPAMAEKPATLLWDNPLNTLPDTNGITEPLDPANILEYIVTLDQVETVVPSLQGTVSFYDFSVASGQHTISVAVVNTDGERGAESDPLVFTVEGTAPDKPTNLRIIFGSGGGGTGPNGTS
jgi:hypothetical protein